MGKGILHNLGTKYIRKSTEKLVDDGNKVHILTTNQQKQLRKISYETYFWSAVVGALAVLLVVLPFHWFAHFFEAKTYTLFGYSVEFELYYMIYAVAMLFPEIWTLNYINLRAVRKMCVVCEYPTKESHDFETHVGLLVEAGLEIPAKHLAEFKIDPYIGLSKFSYYSIFLLNKLKATLSNVAVKLIVKRFLGRYALRIVTDLAGIPIFAFWNAWASRMILKEAKMRIMSTAATHDFLQSLQPNELQLAKPQLGILFHFIAQQKRAYNFALYAFMKEIFTVHPDAIIENSKEIELEDLFTESIEHNLIIARLLVFGFLIDGTLSLKEKRTLKELANQEWFPYTIDELELALKNYNDGNGFPVF